MKILIAGSNGVIGSYVFSKLIELDYPVIGICKEANANNYSFSIDLSNSDETENFVKTFEKPELLIFLVGLAHKKGEKGDFSEFEKINHLTLKNLISALENQNKLPNKIIFASSISVYGERYYHSYYTEETQLFPKSPYAVTKLMAEQYLVDNYKNISIILRFAPVYSQEFKLNIQRRTSIKGIFYRVGKGGNKLSLLSIKNILTAIISVINNQIPPGVYNLSDKREYTFRELLIKQKATRIIFIPKFVVKSLYYINKIIGNVFINENTIKLLTDNIYSSGKLLKYADYNDDLDSTL